MLKPFNVSFSYKLRKGGAISTREYRVNAPSASAAKQQVISAENRGCYRFRINSVTLAQEETP